MWIVEHYGPDKVEIRQEFETEAEADEYEANLPEDHFVVWNMEVWTCGCGMETDSLSVHTCLDEDGNYM